MAVRSPRNRNFYTLLYPESCNNNFKQILDDMHVSAFLSPLHDKDVDEYGNLKKEHYHLMVMFDNPHTLNQFKDMIVTPLGGVGADICISRRGYARYLCHLDHPDKFQYNPSDVVSFCGISYDNLCSSPSDNMNAIKDILDFLDERKYRSYSAFLSYCAKNNSQWFYLMCGQYGRVVERYIKDRVYFSQGVYK